MYRLALLQRPVVDQVVLDIVDDKNGYIGVIDLGSRFIILPRSVAVGVRGMIITG